MSIETFPKSGGGYDASKYKPISEFISYGSSTTYGTALSISGGGFLKSAIRRSGSNEFHDMKIIIDGVVVHESNVTNSSAVVGGLFQNYQFMAMDTHLDLRGPHSISEYGIDLAVYEHPKTDGARGSAVVDMPLFFHESLEILIKSNSAITVILEVQGGVL